ncbi:serine hydrolase domain-containing protein [Gimibacter soli]|uniref:Serine hydrolase n=1 Tax=Gimibacter soli TaxID=3024400 RepID=A0AAE9XV15_9PROT|nr:serine hydrolase [Gimibacter soli]WCL55235.1 serine hydrolase [Gimibacter soli]
MAFVRRSGWKAACLGALLPLGLIATPAGAVDPTAEEALVRIFDGSVEGSPAMSGVEVVVLDQGKVVFDTALGMATFADDGVATPLTTDHKVRIASISKLVATVGLMQLVEAGKVNLDRDISDYLGFSLRNPNFPDTPITLRQILSHTSSIRDGDQYWLPRGQHLRDFFTKGTELYDGGAHFAAAAGEAPGTYFTYSNLNFGVVAGVIERVSGERFDRYMAANVLRPLGLSASYNACDVSGPEPEHLASLFRKSRDGGDTFAPDGPWHVQLDGAKVACHYGMTAIPRGERVVIEHEDFVPGDNPTLFSPQGGLRASAHDLAKVARMFLGRGEVDGVRLLKAETVDAMWTPVWTFDRAAGNGNTTGEDDPAPGEVGPMLSYGLSVDLIDPASWNLGPAQALGGHRGDAYGLLGLFLIDRKSDKALIALMTGFADDPAAHKGETPFYRPEEEMLKWWLRHFN